MNCWQQMLGRWTFKRPCDSQSNYGPPQKNIQVIKNKFFILYNNASCSTILNYTILFIKITHTICSKIQDSARRATHHCVISSQSQRNVSSHYMHIICLLTLFAYYMSPHITCILYVSSHYMHIICLLTLHAYYICCRFNNNRSVFVTLKRNTYNEMYSGNSFNVCICLTTA